ncbi:hypothetical protein [Clostridium baratii]|uniref:hypothetical protein n=1 Tax=Clostridium baratii TaxID=1561 RepID=UPI0030D29596
MLRYGINLLFFCFSQILIYLIISDLFNFSFSNGETVIVGLILIIEFTLSFICINKGLNEKKDFK